MIRFQGEINKLNPGVLRGIDGGTYHFITIPRSGDQEFIDHVSRKRPSASQWVLIIIIGFLLQSLLSPDYMAAQIQNGLVVDIIQTQSSDQHDSLDSHDIYSSDAAVMGDERHYSLHQQHHESSSIVVHPNHISSNEATLHQSDPNFAAEDVIMNEQDRRMTAAFMHYVQKQSPHLLTNEAQVIVSAPKEMPAMASPFSDIDMENNFVASMSQMESSSLQCMPLDKCINLSSDHIPSESNSLPPLPPLTPISKLQTARRTRDLPSQQQIIQYKHVAEDRRLNGHVDVVIDAKYVKIHDDTVGPVPMVQTSKCVRQSSNEMAHAQAPKKTLPHKKRITKKLKSLSPIEEQLQLQFQQAHYQTQLHPYHQPQQHHTAVISLAPQQQSLPSSQSTQIIQNAASAPTVVSSDHQLMCQSQLQSQTVPMGMSSSSSSVITHLPAMAFSCELCGFQSDIQLDFFNHLKLHYEPTHETTAMKTENQKSDSDGNGLDLSAIDLPTFNALEQSSQNMYEMAVTPSGGHYAGNSQASMCRDDENSIGTYAVQSSHHHHTKPDSNDQFSDADDMLENGVVDKVQCTVDNYIKNSTTGGKESDEKDWFEQHEASDLSNHIVYQMTKSNITDDECNLEQGEFHINRHSNGSTVIASTETSEELALIYGKDLNELIDESESDTMLRAQAAETHHDECEYDDGNCGDSNGINYVIEKGKIAVESSDSLASQNIFDEFIEQEKTDSETEASGSTKANGTRKKKKIYRCKRCDKLCYSKNALHYHFLSHTGSRPFVCEICGKSFFAGSALKVHKRLHSGDKPYECSFCNRPFRQWGDLKYHIQSRHTTEKNQQCEFCGKDFARRYSLVIHRRIHTGEKNYKCEYCDKQFRASSYLQVHRKIHTGEKPYNCDVCGKKFRVRGDLKRHANIHERGKGKDAKTVPSAGSAATVADGPAPANGSSVTSMDQSAAIHFAAADDAPKIAEKKMRKRSTAKASKMPKMHLNQPAAIDPNVVINYSIS